jgi:hypothetical protein
MTLEPRPRPDPASMAGTPRTVRPQERFASNTSPPLEQIGVKPSLHLRCLSARDPFLRAAEIRKRQSGTTAPFHLLHETVFAADGDRRRRAPRPSATLQRWYCCEAVRTRCQRIERARQSQRSRLRAAPTGKLRSATGAPERALMPIEAVRAAGAAPRRCEATACSKCWLATPQSPRYRWPTPSSGVHDGQAAVAFRVLRERSAICSRRSLNRRGSAPQRGKSRRVAELLAEILLTREIP